MNRLHCQTALGLIALLASASSLCQASNVSVDQVDLVVDSATTDPTHTNAQTLVDPQLINPWGISFMGNTPFWISDNNSGVAALYSAAGAKTTAINPAIPISNGTAFDNSTNPQGPEANTLGTPTGQVASTAFTIPGHGASAFIFATEDGSIAAWNGGLAAGNQPAIKVVDNSNNTDSGAVYKGLAVDTVTIGGTPTSFLLATNFRAGTIDIFDSNFNKVSAIPGGGSFVDPNLPAGYAPFNVAVLDGKVYVSYALQSADKHDDVGGTGNGIVDSFSLNGTGEQRLISNGNPNVFNGALNSPWGMTIAPSNFGPLAGDLLVGNFKNGWINGFDPNTGAFKGFLATSTGAPVVIPFLWDITTGGGGTGNGSPNTLFFTAGPNDESGGIFGALSTPEPAAVIQALTAVGGLSLFLLVRRKLGGLKPI